MQGGCHCGAVRYELVGEAVAGALCHCSDCRRHAGAPMVAWAMFPEDALKRTKGQTKTYASSEHGRREFCPDCGTGLFYINQQMLPGVVDVQSATLDAPEHLPPRCHIQTAERLAWIQGMHALPEFERFPPQE